MKNRLFFAVKPACTFYLLLNTKLDLEGEIPLKFANLVVFALSIKRKERWEESPRSPAEAHFNGFHWGFFFHRGVGPPTEVGRKEDETMSGISTAPEEQQQKICECVPHTHSWAGEKGGGERERIFVSREDKIRSICSPPPSPLICITYITVLFNAERKVLHLLRDFFCSDLLLVFEVISLLQCKTISNLHDSIFFSAK